jgi:hypothetical protein
VHGGRNEAEEVKDEDLGDSSLQQISSGEDLRDYRVKFNPLI